MTPPAATETPPLPPPSVLRQAGLAAGDVVAVDGHRGVWIVASADLPAVLRVYELRPPWHGIPAVTVVGSTTGNTDPRHRFERLTANVAWLHGFLDGVSAAFPCPSPVGLFDGNSYWAHRGQLWETLTFLPGTVVGWQTEPPLRQIGAFLARYHRAVQSLEVPARPVSTPLGQLAALADSSQATVTMGSTEGRHLLRRLLDELAADLDAVGYHDAGRWVIHGDATTHNVVAGGDPLAPVGLIDFQLAYHEPGAADIGFALWRSGRPRQGSHELDIRRITDFVATTTFVR